MSTFQGLKSYIRQPLSGSARLVFCRERISVFGESETMLCPWACTLGDILTDIIYICVDSSLANLVAIRP
jgi:hypothetical protein